jgi:hypothetical protein
LGRSRDLTGKSGAETPLFRTISADDWRRSIARALAEGNDVSNAIKALVEARQKAKFGEDLVRAAEAFADDLGGPGVVAIPLRVAIKEYAAGKGNADVLMERAHEYASAVERVPAKVQGLAARRSQGRGAR